MPTCFPQKQSIPQNDASGLSNLTSIAALLSEAAQALLGYCKTAQMPEADKDEKKVCSPIEEGYQNGQFHEEIRCFRLPWYIVKREYELLQQHGQNEFFELINRVYEELTVTVMLIRNLDDSAEFSGFELHLLSENLSRPLGVLDSICSQFADYKLVQKTTVPA